MGNEEMNIYDQALALPPMHRRTLAAWLLRTIGTTDKQMGIACREARRIERKRQGKENNNYVNINESAT